MEATAALRPGAPLRAPCRAGPKAGLASNNPDHPGPGDPLPHNGPYVVSNAERVRN